MQARGAPSSSNAIASTPIPAPVSAQIADEEEIITLVETPENRLLTPAELEAQTTPRDIDDPQLSRMNRILDKYATRPNKKACLSAFLTSSKWLWSVPIGNSLYSGLQIGITLYQAGFTPIYSIYVALITFGSSMGLDKRLALDAGHRANKIFRSLKNTGHLPGDMPELSENREMTAITIAIVTGIVSVMYCAIQAFDFTHNQMIEFFGFGNSAGNNTASTNNPFPSTMESDNTFANTLSHILFSLRYAPGVIVAILSSVNMLLSTTIPVYETVRKILAWKFNFYNPFSAVMSVGFGGIALGVPGAIANSLSNISGAIATSNSNPFSNRWFAFGFIPDVFGSVFSDVSCLVESIDEAISGIAHFTCSRSMKIKIASAGITTVLYLLSARGIYEYAVITYNYGAKDTDLDSAATMNTTIPVIATWSTVYLVGLGITTLQPLVRGGLEFSKRAITWVDKQMTARCNPIGYRNMMTVQHELSDSEGSNSDEELKLQTATSDDDIKDPETPRRTKKQISESSLADSHFVLMPAVAKRAPASTQTPDPAPTPKNPESSSYTCGIL